MKIRMMKRFDGDNVVWEMKEFFGGTGVELIDVNNGTPTLYRGYMTVRHSELWEVDTHGRREYWVMSHCPFSSRYMWKYRFVVANRFRVVNGVAGNEWKETKTVALRAAGKYGSVYMYDFDVLGKWSPMMKIYGGTAL